MNRRQFATALAAALLTSRHTVPDALAQPEHQHGEDDIPDWYESRYCCNNKDCAPVKAPDRLLFVWADEERTSPAFLYINKDYPGGILFKKESFRASLDTRFHRCIYIPPGDDDVGAGVPEPRCLYIPGGV